MFGLNDKRTGKGKTKSQLFLSNILTVILLL